MRLSAFLVLLVYLQFIVRCRSFACLSLKVVDVNSYCEIVLVPTPSTVFLKVAIVSRTCETSCDLVRLVMSSHSHSLMGWPLIPSDRMVSNELEHYHSRYPNIRTPFEKEYFTFAWTNVRHWFTSSSSEDIC
jgi:hypothetical protein